MAPETIYELDKKGILPWGHHDESEAREGTELQKAALRLRQEPDILTAMIRQINELGEPIERPRILSPNLPYLRAALLHFRKRFDANMEWVPIIQACIQDAEGLSFRNHLPMDASIRELTSDASAVFLDERLSERVQQDIIYHEWIHLIRNIGVLDDVQDYIADTRREKISSYGTGYTSFVEGLGYWQLFREFRYVRRQLQIACGDQMNRVFIRLPDSFLRAIYKEGMDAEGIRSAIMDPTKFTRSGLAKVLARRMNLPLKEMT